MRSSSISKSNRGKIPASTRRLINKKKVSSHQDDIEEKFARMCLASSESHVSKIENNKPPHKKRSQKKSSSQSVVTGKDKTAFNEHIYVPPTLYTHLQEAAYYIKFLETHKDDLYARLTLEGLEHNIGKLTKVYSEFLPRDWKYDRATAHIWKEVPYFC